MKTVLFDTDYLIDFLRGKSSIKDIISKALIQGVGYISVLSIYELYAGMLPGDEQATEDCINAFHIEPVTVDIARMAGKTRFSYRQRGTTLSIVDCIILETARTNHHLIATMNRKHYPDAKFLVPPST